MMAYRTKGGRFLEIAPYLRVRGVNRSLAYVDLGKAQFSIFHSSERVCQEKCQLCRNHFPINEGKNFTESTSHRHLGIFALFFLPETVEEKEVNIVNIVLQFYASYPPSYISLLKIDETKKRVQYVFHDTRENFAMVTCILPTH